MTATRLTLTATTFDISFAISLTARSFELSEQQIREIEDYVSTFYLNGLNSTVKPKMLCAALIEHMKDGGQIFTTRKYICKVFKVSKSWLRKSKRKNLEKMGIELMPAPSLMTGSSIPGRNSLQIQPLLQSKVLESTFQHWED